MRKEKQAGLSNISAYIRKMAIDGLVIKLDLSDVQEMVRLLRITSDNVNQIAKRANETRNIYEADVVELKARYDSLWDQMESILQGFSKMKV